MPIGKLVTVLPLWISDTTRRMPRSEYLRWETISVYMRYGPYYTESGRADCVTIANITVPAKKRRTGVTTRLLDYIRSITDAPIVIECCLNREWGEALERHGFVCDGISGRSEGAPNYVLHGPLLVLSEV